MGLPGRCWPRYALTPITTGLVLSDVETLRSVVGNTIPRAEAAARKAIEMDPGRTGPRGFGVGAVRRRPVRRRDHYNACARIGSQQPRCAARYSAMLSDVGHISASMTSATAA